MYVRVMKGLKKSCADVNADQGVRCLHILEGTVLFLETPLISAPVNIYGRLPISILNTKQASSDFDLIALLSRIQRGDRPGGQWARTPPLPLKNHKK